MGRLKGRSNVVQCFVRFVFLISALALGAACGTLPSESEPEVQVYFLPLWTDPPILGPEEKQIVASAVRSAKSGAPVVLALACVYEPHRPGVETRGIEPTMREVISNGMSMDQVRLAEALSRNPRNPLPGEILIHARYSPQAAYSQRLKKPSKKIDANRLSQ